MEDRRFWYQTATSELERRWKVTLEAMDKEGIDCLLLHTFSKVIGGPAKYLTDMQSNEYPLTSLFGKEGISVFGIGHEGGPCQADFIAYRNMAENVGMPIIPTTNYAQDRLPSEIAKAIRKYGHKKVGIPNLYNVPASVYKYLTETLPDVEFVGFEDQMDYIMAVKSEYEIGLYKKCVALHDNLIACAPAFLRLGRTEYDVAHDLRSLAVELGCPELNVILCADPVAPVYKPFMYAHRTIRPGDYFGLLVEVAAPGGIWGEVARMYSFGEPSKEMLKANEDQLALQSWLAEQCKPGAKVADIFNRHNERLAEMGYNPERRFNTHGQGYDIVSRPIFTAQETMEIRENMFLAIHPSTRNGKVAGANCDNYLVGPNGAVKLSKTPTDLVVIDHFEP